MSLQGSALTRFLQSQRSYLHEDNSDPHYDAKIKEMRSGPQNNGFLHDFPDEVLAEKKKLLPWNRNS